MSGDVHRGHNDVDIMNAVPMLVQTRKRTFLPYHFLRGCNRPVEDRLDFSSCSVPEIIAVCILYHMKCQCRPVSASSLISSCAPSFYLSVSPSTGSTTGSFFLIPMVPYI